LNNMRLVVALVLLGCVAVSAMSRGYTYEMYMREFQKPVRSEEDYAIRKAIFQTNLDIMVAHNEDKSQTYTMEVNKFMDFTPAELRSFTGYNAAQAQARRAAMQADEYRAPVNHMSIDQLPTSVDWRTKGIISTVKDQGSCGSCWAFGATESIESTVAQDTGKLLTLSTQNVVSCAPNPNHCGGTGGCSGSTAELAFDYVQGHGIASEADYPYKAQTGTCNESIKKIAHIVSFVKLIENNYTDIMAALANTGPLAVNVDAMPWFSYGSGIFTGCGFNQIDINHVVQLVGYGTENGMDYWIVRNSWGSGWGEKGYIRLERHSDGDMTKWCGPDDTPQDGTGCDGGPPQITACGSCGIWYDASYPTGGSIPRR